MENIPNWMAKAEASASPQVQQPHVERHMIAIFGTTPSRMTGPWADDSGWQRWTIGPGGKDHHGWERLFELHGTWPADFRDYLNDLSKVEPPKQVVMLPQPNTNAATPAIALENWHAEHAEEIAKLDGPAIEGSWPALMAYPRDLVLNKFWRRMWFSSSISWLIALAVCEGATDIGLWGIDLESGEEYISQFVGCAHLMDVAQILGVHLHLPKDCGLLRDPAPYPDRWETNFALTTEKKAIWLEQSLAQITVQYEDRKAEMYRLEGRFSTLREVGADVESIKAAELELMNANRHVGDLASNVNRLQGEKDATDFYRRQYVFNMQDPG